MEERRVELEMNLNSAGDDAGSLILNQEMKPAFRYLDSYN